MDQNNDNKKTKLIILLLLVIVSLGLNIFLLTKKERKEPPNENRYSIESVPEIEISNSSSEEYKELIIHSKENVKQLTEKTLNYLSQNNQDNVTAYYGKPEDAPSSIPDKYEINQFYVDPSLAINYAIHLSLTTPHGELIFGQLTEENGVHYKTAVAGDVYHLNSFESKDITNNYDDNHIYLESKINYSAGTSKGYRTIIWEICPLEGTVIDFKITESKDDHRIFESVGNHEKETKESEN